MVKKLFVLTIALLALASCHLEDEVYQDLDMPRQTYSGKELRTDGYFYSGYAHQNKMGSLMLFRNGVCMFTYFENKYGEVIHHLEKEVWQNDALMNEARSTPDGIGVFSVSGNMLNFQIYSSVAGRSTRNCTAEILNDTTLRIKQWRYNQDGSVVNTDELFYFKPFDNKPDSTSAFIK